MKAKKIHFWQVPPQLLFQKGPSDLGRWITQTLSSKAQINLGPQWRSVPTRLTLKTKLIQLGNSMNLNAVISTNHWDIRAKGYDSTQSRSSHWSKALATRILCIRQPIVALMASITLLLSRVIFHWVAQAFLLLKLQAQSFSKAYQVLLWHLKRKTSWG